jgi:hypothetical protein
MKPFPPWLQSETHHALKIGSDWQRETERQQCPWGPSLRCGWKKITGGEQHSRTPSFLGLTLLWFCWMRKGDEMPEQQTNAANGTFQMDPGRQLGTEWYSENLAVPCLVSSHSLSYNMAVCFFKVSTKMTHSHDSFSVGLEQGTDSICSQGESFTSTWFIRCQCRILPTTNTPRFLLQRSTLTP